MKKISANDTVESNEDDGTNADTKCLVPFISEDGKSLTMYIDGEIESKNLNPIINNIVVANMQQGTDGDMAGIEVINIFICSPGGDLTATSQLLTAMDASLLKVRTIGWGSCASAALIILMAGHERFVSPHLILMSHNASTTMGGAAILHAQDTSIQNMNRAINSLMHNFYLNYTGKNLQYIKKHLLKTSKDDMYFTSAEAIKHGFADEIFSSFTQLDTTDDDIVFTEENGEENSEQSVTDVEKCDTITD